MQIDSHPARVVIIGAGVGGLTTGALLAQAGYAVAVLEAEAYAGGSAGTYYHKGYRFDAGATLAGGFQPGGPYALLGERLGIDWPVRTSEPAWIVHLPDRVIRLTEDYGDIMQHFPRSERFWTQQIQASDLIWSMAAQGLPWPPTHFAEWRQLARVGLIHAPRALRLLPLAFRTVYDWLHRFDLADDPAFLRFIDAQLLISAQTTSRHANALYSATALDLPRQGVNHVAGGMGGLAQVLVGRIIALGGTVLFRHRVTRVDVKHGRAVGVQTQRGRRAGDYVPCDFLIANLTPWSLDTLLDDASPVRLRREVQRRDLGWGAFVLYLGIRADKLPPGMPDHHQIVTDMHGPLGEGRSIFVSLSPEWDASRAPVGYRAATVTTHTDVQPWWDALAHDRDAYEARKDAYTERILTAIEHVIPGFRSSLALVMPGTPITYNTFTNRHLGMVGGFPQESLLRARGPRIGLPNVRLVGDSIFPGQSTAAVSLGAMRVVDDVLRVLSRSASCRISQAHVTGIFS